MRLLAIDTSTEACSVSLLTDETVLLRFVITERSHAELVLPMVDSVLTEARVALKNVDALAFGRGPGAFTGLRIAAGIAQGYAIGLGIPVVPISSLAAVAEQVPAQAGERILVCNDARMGETYWTLFERDSKRTLQSLSPERLSVPEVVDLASIGPTHVAGNALARYPEFRARLLAAGLTVHDGIYPRADAVARLAVPEVEAGRTFGPAEALPVYVRDEVATPKDR